MATASVIIDRAYNKIGIPSPTANQSNDGLLALDSMLQLWGADFLTPSPVRENFNLVSGTAEYTIGDGGDFDTDRPLMLIGAYLRDTTQDYPLEIMDIHQFQQLSSKTTETTPSKVFYIPEYPLGKIIFNCESDDTYTVYFEFIKGFDSVSSLSSTIDVPGYYDDALVYNLAVRLAEDNTMEAPRTVIALAEASRIIISRHSYLAGIKAQSRWPIPKKDEIEYKGIGSMAIYSSGG